MTSLIRTIILQELTPATERPLVALSRFSAGTVKYRKTCKGGGLFIVQSQVRL
jgi:hypothetical protein